MNDPAKYLDSLLDDYETHGIEQSFTIMGCTLRLTCYACPEQYDVYRDDKQIGYLRLRHGNFTAEYPDVGGKLVLEAQPMGDGVFLVQERLYWLTKAVIALVAEYEADPN